MNITKSISKLSTSQIVCIGGHYSMYRLPFQGNRLFQRQTRSQKKWPHSPRKGWVEWTNANMKIWNPYFILFYGFHSCSPLQSTNEKANAKSDNLSDDWTLRNNFFRRRRLLGAKVSRADAPRFSPGKQSVLYFSAAQNHRLALIFARKLSHEKNSIQTWSLETVY